MYAKAHFYLKHEYNELFYNYFGILCFECEIKVWVTMKHSILWMSASQNSVVWITPIIQFSACYYSELRSAIIYECNINVTKQSQLLYIMLN